jgi:hypothetical protein
MDTKAHLLWMSNVVLATSVWNESPIVAKARHFILPLAVVNEPEWIILNVADQSHTETMIS